MEKPIVYLRTKSHITSSSSSLVIAFKRREKKKIRPAAIVILQSTKTSPWHLPDISGASVALDSQFYEVAILLLVTERA